MGALHHNKTIYVGILVRLLIIIQYDFTVNALNYNIRTVNCGRQILGKNPQTTILLTIT